MPGTNFSEEVSFQLRPERKDRESIKKMIASAKSFCEKELDLLSKLPA